MFMHTEEAYSVHRLPNGIPVMLERLPHLHSASAGIWIKTGSANETLEQAGISHFLEHLFFKGTQTRTARVLIEAVERQGGQLNAFTSRDYTCIYAKTLDTHIHTAIEILADVLKNSTFCDLEKERNVVLEEIASIEDVPEDYVHEILAAHAWPDHPMGRSVSGAEDSVEALTLEDIQAYYQAWYRPENICISVAGNIDEANVLDQIQREFGVMTPGLQMTRCTEPAFQAGFSILTRDIGQSHFCFGFPGFRVDDFTRFPYDLLSNTLGGGSTSRLFDRLREREGLVYSVYAFHSAYHAGGMLGMYAAVAPENLSAAIDMTCEELRRFRDELTPLDELEMNREQLKGSLLIALEDTYVRMARMAKCMMYFDRVISIAELVEALDAVTPEQMQKLACERFTPESCAVSAIGPEEGKIPESLPL